MDIGRRERRRAGRCSTPLQCPDHCVGPLNEGARREHLVTSARTVGIAQPLATRVTGLPSAPGSARVPGQRPASGARRLSLGGWQANTWKWPIALRISSSPPMAGSRRRLPSLWPANVAPRLPYCVRATRLSLRGYSSHPTATSYSGRGAARTRTCFCSSRASHTRLAICATSSQARAAAN